MKPITSFGLLAIGWYSATYIDFNKAVDLFSRHIIEHAVSIRSGSVVGNAHAHQQPEHTPTPAAHTPPAKIELPDPPDMTQEDKRNALAQSIVALKKAHNLSLQCNGDNSACQVLFILAGQYHQLGVGEE